MEYKPLSEQFRKSPDVQITADFFDTITGISYKKFYLFGGIQAAGAKFYGLTTDSTISSDEENFSVVGTNADIDFDIKIGKAFTVSAEDAIIVMSRNADTGDTQNITFKLRHVDSGAVETDIGTQIGDPISGGSGTEFFLKTCKMAITKKRFVKGDTMRFNVVTSSGNSDVFYFDPSGLQTNSAETPNYPHISYILVPIEVDL